MVVVEAMSSVLPLQQSHGRKHWRSSTTWQGMDERSIIYCLVFVWLFMDPTMVTHHFSTTLSNLSDGRKETKESLYKCQISWCVLNVHVLRRDPRCDLRLQSREFNAAMFTASEGGGGIYGRWDNKFLHFLSLKGLLCLLQSRWCFFFQLGWSFSWGLFFWFQS